jgi:hypothetical protein
MDNEIITGQANFTMLERDQILQIVQRIHPGCGISMKSALRKVLLEYSKIDLTSEEIREIKKITQSDSLIEAMCKLTKVRVGSNGGKTTHHLQDRKGV